MKNLWLVGFGLALLSLAGVVLRNPEGSSPVAPNGAAIVATGTASRREVPQFLDQGLMQPLPLSSSLDQRKVALGDRLFHEKRLSSDGTISCASCHDLERGGDDNRRYSIGVNGTVGTVNAPTVLNGAFNFRQFWDGRAASLETQVDGPLLHPGEMSSAWAQVLPMLQGDPSYTQAFDEIYPNGVTADNLRDSIATFERSLITPNARFDRHLRGEKDVLTEAELAGFQLFTDIGCVTCHSGINIGGSMFQVFGRTGNYFEDRGNIQPADLGRFNATGDERDKFKFKVPSLRNVELTAPYLHDGSAATLEEAIQVMARYQIGTSLRDGELASLVAFLKSLTGESPKRP